MSDCQKLYHATCRVQALCPLSNNHLTQNCAAHTNTVSFLFFPISSLQVAKIRVRIGEWDFSTTSEVHPHIERKVLSLKNSYISRDTCMWEIIIGFSIRNLVPGTVWPRKMWHVTTTEKKCLTLKRKRKGKERKNLGGEFRHPGFPFLLSNFYAVDCEGENPPHALNQMLENMSLLFFDDLRERRNSKSFSSEFPVLATTKGLKKCQKQQQDPWI